MNAPKEKAASPWRGQQAAHSTTYGAERTTGDQHGATEILSTTHNKTRIRRTGEEISQLEKQIYAVLKADHPQSVRHVFYRMTDPRLPVYVEKSEKGYRDIQYRMTEMRRGGELPYDWITDATRRGHYTHTFTSGADFVRAYAGLYRADLWAHAEAYVEVWCESRSIAGVIEQDCNDLAVSLFPSGGFSSLTLAYASAMGINQATGKGEKAAHVIYIGDYDPAGVLIDQSIEKELRTHLHPDVDLSFHRLAITESQIEQYDLPTKPRKAGDKRARHVKATVEAEAMPAHILRKMLRDAIEAFLPDGALEIARIAEESERAGLLAMAEAMEGESDYGED
jgi:hypothetical protein